MALRSSRSVLRIAEISRLKRSISCRSTCRRVQGLGVSVGFGAQGLGFRVQSFGHSVQDLVSRVQGSGCRAQGLQSISGRSTWIRSSGFWFLAEGLRLRVQDLGGIKPCRARERRHSPSARTFAGLLVCDFVVWGLGCGD